jgi:hypothetical protein
MDATDVSNLLQVFGTLLAFIGSVVTGVGLWLAWRRLLQRRADERRVARRGGSEHVPLGINSEGTGLVMPTPVPGGPPDAPVTSADLKAVVVSIHKEIQVVRNDLHGVRADIAGLSIVESGEVDARAQNAVAEHEREEGSTALGDLQVALIGVGISALGSVLGILGLFVGWYG